MSHTILLYKISAGSTQTWSDHPTVAHALEKIITLFETRLKELNPKVREVSYDIGHLTQFIQIMGDLSALV